MYCDDDELIARELQNAENQYSNADEKLARALQRLVSEEQEKYQIDIFSVRFLLISLLDQIVKQVLIFMAMRILLENFRKLKTRRHCHRN